MELQALHSLVLIFSMLDRQQPHAWDFADGLDVAVSGLKKKNCGSSGISSAKAAAVQAKAAPKAKAEGKALAPARLRKAPVVALART